jgi:hypothetical protein
LGRETDVRCLIKGLKESKGSFFFFFFFFFFFWRWRGCKGWRRILNIGEKIGSGKSCSLVIWGEICLCGVGYKRLGE